MDAKLPDPRPLIHVCDRHDFIEEMTGYLYKSSLQKYIEVRTALCPVCRPPVAWLVGVDLIVSAAKMTRYECNCMQACRPFSLSAGPLPPVACRMGQPPHTSQTRVFCADRTTTEARTHVLSVSQGKDTEALRL